MASNSVAIGGFHFSKCNSQQPFTWFRSYLGKSEANYVIPDFLKKTCELCSQVFAGQKGSFEWLASKFSSFAKPANFLYAGFLVLDFKSAFKGGWQSILSTVEKVTDTFGTCINAMFLFVNDKDTFGLSSDTRHQIKQFGTFASTISDAAGIAQHVNGMRKLWSFENVSNDGSRAIVRSQWIHHLFGCAKFLAVPLSFYELATGKQCFSKFVDTAIGVATKAIQITGKAYTAQMTHKTNYEPVAVYSA